MPSKQAPTLRLPTYDTARNALESVSWNDRGRKWGMPFDTFYEWSGYE